MQTIIDAPRCSSVVSLYNGAGCDRGESTEDVMAYIRQILPLIPKEKRPFFESAGQIHLDKDEIMRYREMNTL